MTDRTLTEEDRKVLAALVDDYDAVPNAQDGRLIARALAHIDRLEDEAEIKRKIIDGMHLRIDHLEGALREINEEYERALVHASWPYHAMAEDHPDMPEWARESIRWLQGLEADAERYEGALREIVDLGPAVTTEGVGNAAAIARAALDAVEALRDPAPTEQEEG